jgi:repressor LexA
VRKPTRELTSRQQEVLEALCQWMKDHGYPPSIRELGEAVGLSSTRSVHDHLRQLERKGFIRRHRDHSRAIEILKMTRGIRKPRRAPAIRDSRHVGVPIVGEVAAGSPILADARIDGELELDVALVPDPSCFLLRVRGESMIGAHVCDGDLIMVRPQQEARNGEIVVVLIEDSVTLKRFYRREGFVELKPENGQMASILLTPEMGQARILGRLMGVIRRYR